jgi:RNA recognition motif-containing protein
MEVSASDNTFVGGLPPTITEDQVKQVFGTSGTVVSCRVLPAGGDKTSALVRFNSVEQAAWMVENVNGNVPAGLVDPVVVKFAEQKTNRYAPPAGAAVVAPPSKQEVGAVPASDKIFVSSLPPLDQDAVKLIFEAYGTVTSVKMVGNTSAVVRFGSDQEAKRVVEGLNGVVLQGLDKPVSIQFADTPGAKAERMGMMSVIVNGFVQSGVLPGGRWGTSDNAVHIAGLPSDTEDVHLYRLFSSFGPIAPRGCRAMMNPDGTCKGIAFVNFLTSEAVQAAVTTFNGALLPDGTTLKVSAKTRSSPY